MIPNASGEKPSQLTNDEDMKRILENTYHMEDSEPTYLYGHQETELPLNDQPIPTETSNAPSESRPTSSFLSFFSINPIRTKDSNQANTPLFQDADDLEGPDSSSLFVHPGDSQHKHRSNTFRFLNEELSDSLTYDEADKRKV